jgi:N-acyl-phosphatidylethanolamine-hydrolysing phospholipase D
MQITWIGGATFLLQLGNFRILADPVFSHEFSVGKMAVTRKGDPAHVDFTNLTAVCVSCPRGDHFDRGVGQLVDPTVPAYCPAEAEEVVVAAGFAEVKVMAWEDRVSFEQDDEQLEIIAVPAPSRSGTTDNGYFFVHKTPEKEYTAYWTGDALWSDEVRSIQQNHGYSNLLILHLGAERGENENNIVSADAKEAMQIVYRMQPNAIVPIHHHTFSHFTEPVSEFEDKLSVTIYDRRLHILTEGKSYQK